MNELFPSPQTPSCPQMKFKLVGEDPAASLVREFTSLKSLRQFKARNNIINAISYIFHDGNWERFVIHGSQVIPKSVLLSLLNSLNP